MNPRIPIHQRFFITRQQLLNTLSGSISSDTMRLMTPFSNANIEYNINVFPNGRSPAENGRFLLFLQFKFTKNFRLTASYTFIVGGSQQRSFEHCYKTSSSFGGILCPRQLIFYPNCMLVQDRLNIELHGHVTIQNFSLYTISPRASISPRIVNTNTVRRLPAVPSSKIVQKEKSIVVVETSKQSETEANIARILQQHLEEERRTSINGGGNEAPVKEKRRSSKNADRLPKVVRSSPKKAAPVVVLEDDADPKETSTNENLTSAAAVISKEADQTKAAAAATEEEYEMNATDISSDTLDASNAHEPLPSSKPSQTPKTNEPESHQTTASSTPSTEEPNRNKRVRTRTARYVQFFVNDDDDDAPATKRSRKRKSDASDTGNASNENEEYLPPSSRRSKSSARTRDAQDNKEKIEYDCKIEGVQKVFDVNKKILSQKSNGFALLFETNTESTNFELEGIPDETLEAAFNFCHGTSLKEDMNTKEYNSILFFAKTFEIPELKSFCEERLAEKSSSTNSSPNANLPAATKPKPQKLQKNCKNYLIENVRNNTPLETILN